jgi:hypothetical protein
MDCFLYTEYSKDSLRYEPKKFLPMSDISFLSSVSLQERSG